MLVLPKGTVVPRDLPKGRACFFLRMLAAHTRWLFPLEEDRLRPHLVLPNNFSCPGELRSEQAKLTVVEGPQRSPRSHHRRPGPPMNRAIRAHRALAGRQVAEFPNLLRAHGNVGKGATDAHDAGWCNPTVECSGFRGVKDWDFSLQRGGVEPEQAHDCTYTS